jgi:hypothetical protein
MTGTSSSAVRAIRWDADDVSEMLLSLEPQDYRNSEWADTGKGMILECDVYLMKYDITMRIRSATGLPVYSKFGFTRTRPTIIIISCHVSY